MTATDDLVAACQRKDAKAAAAALAAGANPNGSIDGEPMLKDAIERKSKSLALALLAGGASVDAVDRDGRGVLHWLAEHLADCELAALALDRGADIDRLDTDEFSAKSALHRAVLRPKLELAELLVARGAAIDIADGESGSSPLLCLCKSGSGEMSKTELANASWLIEQGADIERANDDGERPLHYAARSSRAMTELLLARGARITNNNFGQTPLFYCLSTDDRDKARWDLLIAAGCDVNHRDCTGRTPLLEAQSSWNPIAVSYLLAKGADPTIADDSGETALASAQRLKQTKIIALLDGKSAATRPPTTKPARPAKATKPAKAKSAARR